MVSLTRELPWWKNGGTHGHFLRWRILSSLRRQNLRRGTTKNCKYKHNLKLERIVFFTANNVTARNSQSKLAVPARWKPIRCAYFRMKTKTNLPFDMSAGLKTYLFHKTPISQNLPYLHIKTYVCTYTPYTIDLKVIKSILSTNELATMKKSVQTNVYSAQWMCSITFSSDWCKYLIPPKSWPSDSTTKYSGQS